MKILYTSLLVFYFTEAVILPRIPNHLLACYSGGGPKLWAPHRLDVLLSLITKLEVNSPLDLRLFSGALLKSLRLDGVERAANGVETEFVLPYRASAFQFHKYRLLMEMFIPTENLLVVDEILTLEEKCLLHKLLSSGVSIWERGDENAVCPVSVELRQNVLTDSNSRSRSRCPIENGVIQTAWGPISAGTVVAAIAASLEFQRVSVNDILNAEIFKSEVAEPLLESAKQEWFDDIETLDERAQRQVDDVDISNIWAATLAGDLSEVVINQGPRVGAVPQHLLVGSNSRWNDTILPRAFYLMPQNSSVIDWHFTDAEILAGIDGLILANYVPSWVNQRRTLRLAQILDMYYSTEGISFDPRVKACNRQSLFNNMFNSSTLSTETLRFASMLSLKQITVYIPLEEMERITAAAVTAFTNYVPSVLRQYHTDCPLNNSVSEMDLIVATDGSWKGYDVEQFISWIGGALDLNFQRSTLGIVHGNTGRWVVPTSNNLTTVFSNLANFTDEWPTRMNLPNIITTVIQHSLNKTLDEIAKDKSAGRSTVVLIISPSDNPSANDLERARELMNSLRMTYYDVYFVYVARDPSVFQNINNEFLDYSERFITTQSTSVHDTINAVDTNLVKGKIPTRIMGPQCSTNGTYYNQTEYEDFVLPNRDKMYRIHPYYLRYQPLINVQFRNIGQGRLLVCTWRGAETSHNCQTIEDRALYTFSIPTPCPSPDFCLEAQFLVVALNSSNMCANTDCRLPHQVGYYLQHDGLRCLALHSSAVWNRNFGNYKLAFIYLALWLSLL